MSRVRLKPEDLPLGRLAPRSRYNTLLVAAIEKQRDGGHVSQAEIGRLLARQKVLFERIESRKSGGMGAFGRHAARRYGFGLRRDGALEFHWKRPPFNRIGHESDYYASEARDLAPVDLDPRAPRVVVFATGRAFAERNARLGYITQREALQRARQVMSAQVHLVGSRLVPWRHRKRTKVAAVAYDMVTSEAETPAVRIQSLLVPGFTHPTAVLAAERMFGPLVADAVYRKNGSFARRSGKILGEALPEDELLANLRGLVLVGASVGCIVSFQAVRWLDGMLRELGVRRTVRREARTSMLIVNLGPTTVLPRTPAVNLVSVVNRNDEFVLAGNDVAWAVRRADRSGCLTVADPRTSGHRVTVVIDAQGTISRNGERLVFDPAGSHYGHSMKHYANALRDLRFGAVVRRALQTPGGFRTQDLFDAARDAGELRNE